MPPPTPSTPSIITPQSPLWTAPTQNLSVDQDALRWRALNNRLLAIEQNLAKAVKFNDFSAPGGSEILAQTVRTGLLLGPGGPNTSTVVDNFQSLLRVVYDANGIGRVQSGSLANYTGPNGVNSPAQFGERILDSSGNVISDSSGITSVIKSLGIVNPSTQSFTSTTFSAVTGGSISFSLSRQLNVLALFLATGRVATNNGNVGFIRINQDSGVFTSGNLNFGVLANFASTSTGWFFASLAAGSHTLNLDGAINATPQTFTMIEAAMQVFQVGA